MHRRLSAGFIHLAFAFLLCVPVFAALLATGFATGTANAEEPFRLNDSVTDRSGVLGTSGTQEVQAAVSKLRADTGIQLFVVYVPNFGSDSAATWTNQTADISDLGADDALLAIATQSRAYNYSVASDFPISDAELRKIALNNIEPKLAEGDWAGAGVAAATAYDQTLTSGGGGGSWFWWFIGALVLGAIVYLIYRSFSRKRSTAGGGGAEQSAEAADLAGIPTPELAKRANALLIDTDDAIKSSDQELGFAEAQFGEPAVEKFRSALVVAKNELAAAFSVRQKLDDDVPEDEPAQRSMYAEIIERCNRANEGLDQEATAFARLRDLESTVQDVLPQLTTRTAELEARVPSERAKLGALTTRYAPEALQSVAANPDQATERIAFAKQAIAKAVEELDADRRGQAVVAAQAAEEALGQATTLLDSVANVETDLQEATSKVAAARTEITEELVAARQFQASGQGGDLSAVIANTETALAATVNTNDPIGALRRLEAADEALDEALASVRDIQERAQKASQLLEQSLLAARSEITAAQDFITTRRGAVGGEARTRLAEAARYYDQAVSLAQSDPAGALESARYADQLAQQASSLAQSDVSQWQQPASSGMGGGGSQGSGMSGMAGAMLGGLLANVLSGGGGGSRGGGFGFGGASSSSRGGGGGRSSGGGRRGGGGRF